MLFYLPGTFSPFPTYVPVFWRPSHFLPSWNEWRRASVLFARCRAVSSLRRFPPPVILPGFPLPFGGRWRGAGERGRTTVLPRIADIVSGSLVVRCPCCNRVPCDTYTHTHIHAHAEWKSGVRFFHWCESFRFVSCRFVSSGPSRGFGDRSTVVRRLLDASLGCSSPSRSRPRCASDVRTLLRDTPVVRLCSPLSHPRAASCDRTCRNQWICRGVQCSFVVSSSVPSAYWSCIIRECSSLRGVCACEGHALPRGRGEVIYEWRYHAWNLFGVRWVNAYEAWFYRGRSSWRLILACA